MKNEYLPYPAIIEKIQTETLDTKTFRVAFTEQRLIKSFDYRAGQFMQVSLLGIGEAPISLTSSPSRKGFLEFTIRAIGKLTRAMHQLKEGDTIYLRGPYGNSFPLEEAKGRHLYFLAGGIGLPPLRSVINQVFDQRKNFDKIKILYGARTPDELCFKEELKAWSKMPDTQILLSVDRSDETWKGNTGVVTTLCDKMEINTSCGIAYICGPPIMIKFASEKLINCGFKDENIYITLERYMKCGIGKCGHCNIGGKFVCIDGPVFSYRQLKEFPVYERALV